MDVRYQVFVFNSSGWAWQGNSLEKAKAAAQRWAKQSGVPAYVADTNHGGIIFTAESK